MMQNDKIKYKKILINNYKCVDESIISFENKKIISIIGLNGTGKSILLQSLETLFDDKKDEIEKISPKFSKEEIMNSHNLTTIEVIYEDDFTTKEIIGEFFPKINKNVISTNSFLKVWLDKEIIFLPLSIEDFNSIDWKTLNEDKDNLIIGSKEFKKLLMEKSWTFNILDTNNPFMKNSRVNSIFSNESGIETYEKILFNTDSDWKGKIQKYINMKLSDEHGEDIKNLRKLITQINSNISNMFFSKDPKEKEQILLKKIFQNLSGRNDMKDNNNTKISFTKPDFHLEYNSKNNDIDIHVGFIEMDVFNDEERSFDITEKNDGFNLIFWFLIYTKFIIEDSKTAYILIDEFGNYLNPTVIKYMIEYFKEVDANVIFTSHNPYTITNSIIGSIHICKRNDLNNFTQIKYWDDWSHLKNIFSKIATDKTIKLIIDAFSLNAINLEWRIDETKINVFVEGVSELVLLSNFSDGDSEINFLTIGGTPNVYTHSEFMFPFKIKGDLKYCYLVDHDFFNSGKNVPGSAKFEEAEIKFFNKDIYEVNSFDNDVFELEDIFIKVNHYVFKKFVKEHKAYENIKNISEIKDKFDKRKLKNLIINHIFNIAMGNGNFEDDESYDEIREIINNKIILGLKNKFKMKE